MKHLVIAVSPDSSLDLLGQFADIVLLDQGNIPEITQPYETLYIRSHFGSPVTLPQNFRAEIDKLVSEAKRYNPNIKFVDGMNTVDEIVAFEDKWLQYQTFSEFMPKTRLYSSTNTADFKKPIYKNRLSSRGNGVTWDENEVTGSTDDWIIQESLNIAEELRVYVIKGAVHPIGAVRRSMTSEQSTQAVSSRQLSQEEIDFAANIGRKAPTLDIIGLDIALTSDTGLVLMEVNRSPGFGAFEKLTGVNLATELYT